METEKGRTVRADYRCTSAAEGERYAWEQELEGSPFERILAASSVQIDLAAEGDGRLRGPAAQHAEAARPLPARLADDARRHRAQPGRGARRDRGARSHDFDEVVGLGRGGEAARGPRARPGRCCAIASASAEPAPAVALEEVALKRRRSVPESVLDAAGAGTARHRPRGADPLRGRSRLSRPRPASRRSAGSGARRRDRPGRRRRASRRCSTRARARASQSSPSGAAPASSVGSSRSAVAHRAVVTLDLSRLRTVRVDRTSLTANLGPGLRGPQAESALRAHGLTLGHFPQSFEYATIGGFAATRSAGQASCGYGRFDEMVTSVRMASPAGRDEHPRNPAHGGRPGAARADPRLRGRARSDHGCDREGPPGARGVAL